MNELTPDYIPPEIGFPLAIVLALIYVWMTARAGREELQAYISLDCRDGAHRACDSCGCECHR